MPQLKPGPASGQACRCEQFMILYVSETAGLQCACVTRPSGAQAADAALCPVPSCETITVSCPYLVLHDKALNLQAFLDAVNVASGWRG